MINKIKYLALGMVFFLAACEASGPQKTLDEMASALENNNPSLFLSQVEMGDYAKNYVKNYTRDDLALNSINQFSNMLGLGGIDSLINSIVDIKSSLANQFERGVASGEMIAQCATATTPDCPWVPQSLRDARIIQVGEGAAIAKITTPARLTSWLALRQFGKNWLVVGHAVLEANARECALAASPLKIDPKKPQVSL